jgi:SAM-dependent methyltransferase
MTQTDTPLHSARESTPCLLCGSTDYQVRYTVPDMLLGLPGSFRLVQCNACGLVYQNPRPTPQAMGSFYPPDYDPFVTPPWSNPSLLQRLLHLHGLKKRWRLVERHAPRRSGRRAVLDVGCATGLFLAAASDSWSTAGVEPTAMAAQAAREQFGLRIYTGTLEEAVAAGALAGRQFDAITMWDVLEHLHDPLTVLEHMRRLLRPDGVLVLRVPTLDSWDARLLGRYWAGLDQPRHTFVPDRTTLRALLARAGFTIREERCINGSYHVLMLSWRFWLRHYLHDPRQLQRAERALNNVFVRAALLPPLAILDQLWQRGPLLSVVARPASGTQRAQP